MKYKKSILFIFLLSINIFIMACSGKSQILIENKNNKAEESKEYDTSLEEINKKELEETLYTSTLLAVGDIMFHSPQFRAAYDPNTGLYDFLPVFKYVKKYIDGADISLGNLETVIGGSHIEYSGFPRFNTPKESVIEIAKSGFNILNTGNNHSLDQGKDGLINTIKIIDAHGMKNIGTYINRETEILVEEVNGIKISFLSYTYGLNGLESNLSPEELSYMVNLIDEEKIKSDIEKTNKIGVDLTVVYIHWGYEYHMEASDYQVELGEKMLKWGADIILGAHPHVVQRSEILNLEGKDKFIVYSMGNFLSNQRKSSLGNPYTEDGIMIKFQIEKSSLTEDTRIKSIEYIPTWVYRYRKAGKLSYEILPIEDALNGDLDIEIDETMKERLKKSLNNTMEKMQRL